MHSSYSFTKSVHQTHKCGQCLAYLDSRVCLQRYYSGAGVITNCIVSISVHSYCESRKTFALTYWGDGYFWITPRTIRRLSFRVAFPVFRGTDQRIVLRALSECNHKVSDDK